MNRSDLDERRRLAVLHSFHVLDTPPEPVFDQLVQLAARICETPIATISLVDEQRQWFKSSVGLDMRETDRSISFCTHTIRNRKPFVVRDAREHPLFRDNPLVTGPPHLVFYAGIPLISRDHDALGALAVMDHVPRTLTDTQLSLLAVLADQVMMHIECRRQQNELVDLGKERDQANAELLSQTRRLLEAQRIGGIGSWELNIDSMHLSWSHETYRVFGISAENFGERLDDFMALVHPEDRERIQEALQRAIEGREQFDIEYRIVRPDGQERRLHGRGELITGEGGATMLFGTIQDITARHRSQELLILLGTCVSRINEIVMITEAEPLDEPGPRIVFVNDAFERETGYSREEVLGRSPRMLQGRHTQRDELDRIRAALENPEPVSAELINYTKSGREFWEEIRITPVFQGATRPTHFVAVQRNITERKQKLDELTRTNRALEMLTRCNETLLKAESEQDLLDQICRVAVEAGGYRMAWVGYAQHDEAHSVRPVTSAGAAGDLDDIKEITVSWSADLPTGQGPGGRAIREGVPIVCEDIENDCGFAPWKSAARRRGYFGVICLPLRDNGQSFGILSLHTTEVRPVAESEITLLQRLADNLAFGIMHIRAEHRQRRIEEAVRKVAAGVSASSGTEFFEQLARSMSEALGAQAAFVARFLPGTPLAIRTLGAVIGEKVCDNFAYVIEGTSFESCFRDEICDFVMKEGEGNFPPSCAFASLDMRSCVGRRLVNLAGEPVGAICVFFRGAVPEQELTASTLQIFAARAAVELERLEADARVRDQASLLDKAKDAIMVANLDDGCISFWNRGAERLFGWTAKEIIGKSKRDLIVVDKQIFDQAQQAVREHGEWSGELRKRRKDGHILVVECHWTLVKDDPGKPQSILAIDTDISQRKAAEREIESLAFYDPLTRLPNRRLLLDRLQHALEICKRNNHTGALLFIDLDNFKTLNDTLGHDKGDLLLQHVARRLEKCARRNNTVARLGGDEFVVMLEDLSKTSWEAASQAEIVGEKILGAFTKPFELDGCVHHSTPSIGVALFDNEVRSVDELLKRADLAMYQAKAAGRNTVRFFDPQMQTVVNARVALEADLRQGLEQHEFFLHYQPQTARDGSIMGVEALVRWHSASRGLVSPAAFIPLAEETGLIIHLGQWVLETVCEQLAAWAARPETAHLSVAVNVSARQFHHPEFVGQVLSVLHNTGVDPHRLKLELTESLLVSNLEDTIAKMTALKEKGVGFSLDDFGTGYSSLSYLKRLPLDQVKIDRSFVKDVLVDSNDAAIARTIVALGHILGLEVVAEGVETEDQRAFLAQHGCHGYQGFLFGQPLPAEQI